MKTQFSKMTGRPKTMGYVFEQMWKEGERTPNHIIQNSGLITWISSVHSVQTNENEKKEIVICNTMKQSFDTDHADGSRSE